MIMRKIWKKSKRTIIINDFVICYLLFKSSLLEDLKYIIDRARNNELNDLISILAYKARENNPDN